MLNALTGSTPNTFVQDIGADVFAAWQNYVGKLSPTPAFSQWSDLFLNWAMLSYPAVATIGATDLAQIALDPILSAQLAAATYTKYPNWSQGYADLVAQLSKAPARQFVVSTSTMNSDVSKTWTGGSTDGLFGLWGDSSSTSTYSAEFAGSDVAVTAQFAHVTTFQASPGGWYNSAALGSAYAHQSGAPWTPGKPTNWENTFDPKNGNMARFAVNLVVCSEMDVTVTSAATFSTEDQTVIQSNSSAGMWPFYTSGGSSSSSTDVKFNQDGTMSVHITSEPDVPIVLGCTVLPASQYLGHAVAAAESAELALAAH